MLVEMSGRLPKMICSLQGYDVARRALRGQ